MSTLDAAVQGILRDDLAGRSAGSRAAEAVALIERHLDIRVPLPVPTEWAHKIPAAPLVDDIREPLPVIDDLTPPKARKWWRAGR